MSTNMFKSFEHQPVWYIPDNMHELPKNPVSLSLNNNNLDFILDNNDPTKIRGYSWNFGETCEIPISVNKQIFVNSDSYITDIINDHPTEHTEGHYLQKFYNTVDVRSWTMVDFEPTCDKYTWQEDEMLTFMNDGDMLINITPKMFGRKIVAKFLNFRKELLLKFVYEDVNDTEVIIDKETSSKLLRGVYTLEIYIEDEYRNSLVNRYEIIVR